MANKHVNPEVEEKVVGEVHVPDQYYVKVIVGDGSPTMVAIEKGEVLTVREVLKRAGVRNIERLSISLNSQMIAPDVRVDGVCTILVLERVANGQK
jgi:hypothetical protein